MWWGVLGWWILRRGVGCDCGLGVVREEGGAERERGEKEGWKSGRFG